MSKNILFLIFIFFLHTTLQAQNSIARRWNEVQLAAIRQDLARPPVQARNLFLNSVAMYDAWAVYHPQQAITYLLGKTINGTNYAYNGYIPLLGNDTIASQNMALSYAAYRVLSERYSLSPNAVSAQYRFDTLMTNLGYDINYTGTNYMTGTPADLGNYLADQIFSYGINDGSNQLSNFQNTYYTPINSYLYTAAIGSSNMLNPNRWQPLNIVTALDQNGNPVNSNQTAICPEWGNVIPFSLDPSTAVTHTRDGNNYLTYIDPGGPSTLDTTNGFDVNSMHYKWANQIVAIWSSLVDPSDNTMIDISPKGRGNLTSFPLTQSDQYSYYNYYQGGDYGTGHPINPATNAPYAEQLVKRADYARVISQYWADGPQSETPPGHWFIILNKVSSNPLFVKKFKGVGPVLSNLEWDVKSYLTLGGSLHDAAIAAWSLKGWYDSPRPISVIRKMAEYGQSSDINLPHYHKAGLQLIPGYIELITASDSLAIVDPANINKIKVKAWKGFDFITNPTTDVAGVGWILAENWMPYQRKTFVTPPFAGYVSGHSTYSRTGAEVMTTITGNAFFPGGIYETVIDANSNFLQFEAGPSTQIRLQWATYTDASNEASISRIWGGIHPPTDDAPGRAIGIQIANLSVIKAETYFNNPTLAAHLISFTSVEKDCQVNLYWKTDRESNAKKYELWNSTDGLHFNHKLGEIVAKGNNSNATFDYTLTDINPSKFNVYQLVEIDNNGKKTVLGYNRIKLSNCINSIVEKLSIYPNPVIDKTTLQINSTIANSKAIINITDVLGKNVRSQSLQLRKGNNSITIDLSSLKAGNYFINVVNATEVINTIKFVKLK